MKRAVVSFVLIGCMVLILCYLLIFFGSAFDKIAAVQSEPAPSGYYVTYADNLGVTTLADYKRYLNLLDKDMRLIPYEALLDLGSFSYFTYLSDWTAGTYEKYYYILCDKHGYDCLLYIKNKSAETDSDANVRQVIDKVENLNDLRTLGAAESGFFYVDEIQYKYSNGVLQEIAWNSETHQIILSPGDAANTITEYPMDTDTFLAQLLNAESAKKAINRFNAKVDFFLFIRSCKPVALWLQALIGVCLLVLGILQIHHKPVMLVRKRMQMIQDEEKRKKFMRSCGCIKVFSAAMVFCMVFALMSEPVFICAYLAVYVFLLLLIMWLRQLTIRGTVPVKKYNIY